MIVTSMIIIADERETAVRRGKRNVETWKCISNASIIEALFTWLASLRFLPLMGERASEQQTKGDKFNEEASTCNACFLYQRSILSTTGTTLNRYCGSSLAQDRAVHHGRHQTYFTPPFCNLSRFGLSEKSTKNSRRPRILGRDQEFSVDREILREFSVATEISRSTEKLLARARRGKSVHPAVDLQSQSTINAAFVFQP